MRISVRKADSKLTIALGFVSVQLNLNNVEETANTIVHFAQLAGGNEVINKAQIEQVKYFVQMLGRAFTLAKGCNYNAIMNLNTKTNKLSINQYTITKGEIDILAYIELVKEILAIDDTMNGIIKEHTPKATQGDGTQDQPDYSEFMDSEFQTYTEFLNDKIDCNTPLQADRNI